MLMKGRQKSEIYTQSFFGLFNNYALKFMRYAGGYLLCIELYVLCWGYLLWVLQYYLWCFKKYKCFSLNSLPAERISLGLSLKVYTVVCLYPHVIGSRIPSPLPTEIPKPTDA